VDSITPESVHVSETGHQTVDGKKNKQFYKLDGQRYPVLAKK
jgi:negative regulator of sigma E activity